LTNSITIERRLAAILAADVEGYSRLMGADEVGTLRGLTERRAILDKAIADHRGRIANTAGDSVLAEFGSAVDAVQCAVEAQAALAEANESLPTDKRINFRIGIHVGDVMVRAGDLFGDGVNIAARLQTLAQPGGVCVSGTAHEHVRKVLSVAFTDLGAQQFKNIEEAVRVYSASCVVISPASSRAEPEITNALPLPDKPSIAVLPFQNMSGDPEQEYFADGIVEDIITAPSRYKSLFVIARNSTFTFKGRAVDVKQVGRELGVRYVLEGSVRKAGGRVRITGQLIEAASGAHLWADKFEGPFDDVFDLQDRVTSAVAGIVGPKIEQTEIDKARKKSTSNLEAYDCYLRGIDGHNQWTREGNEDAIHMLARAIELDPRFAAAMARLCSCYTQRLFQNWMSDPIGEAAEACRLARLALDIDNEDPLVLGWSALTLATFEGVLETAVPLLDRALELNPNMMVVHQVCGVINGLLGNVNTALEHHLTALRLSPHDALGFSTFNGLMFDYFFLGQDDQALFWTEKALAINPKAIPVLRWSAAVFASTGHVDRAKEVAARLVELNPTEAISKAFAVRALRKTEHKQKLIEGLRAAGLPE
jgi:adenylate cyclase